MASKMWLLVGYLLVFAGLAFADGGVLHIKVLPGAPSLSVRATVEGLSGDNLLRAGETGRLVIFVENHGPGDAFNVEVSLTPNKRPMGLAFDRKIPFGTVRAGEAMTRQIGLKGDQHLPDDVVILEIEARSENGRAVAAKLVVRTKATAYLPPGGDDVDRRIPEGERAGKHDVGVIIGNRHYTSSGVSDVEYADRDAQSMKKYLVKTLGYDPANVIYAENATFAKFNEILGSDRAHKGRLYNYLKPGVSRVFIYYSGHGAPDIESHDAYLLPVDGSPAYIRANGYALQTFYDNLSRLPAKKITVVLDACFSGNSPKGTLFQGVSPAVVKVKTAYQGPTDATIIAGAAIDEVATWYPEKGHSLFTYYFLKGLQGEADLNKDRRITVGEMKAYLGEHVPYMARRLGGIEQHPVISGDEEDVMAVLKR